MGPMTKGSNLPYRRLCVELGARITMSEMTVARRLKQRRQGEFALIRRFEGEPCFGVQLAGTNPEEMGWAAALVESRGADLVDLNCGCPIDHFTHKGIGASLGRQPKRIRRIVEAMKKAVDHIPVTVKIRLGWNDEMRNVHRAGAGRGRRRRRRARSCTAARATRAIASPPTGTPSARSRPRCRCRWSATATCCSRTTSTPLAHASGCAGVMIARGALIKPWLFREVNDGYRDLHGR